VFPDPGLVVVGAFDAKLRRHTHTRLQEMGAIETAWRPVRAHAATAMARAQAWIRPATPPRPTLGAADVRVRLIVFAAFVFAVLAGVLAWVLNAPAFDNWLRVHAGISDLSGTYYGFWSGVGSDIAEFSLVGAAFTGVYQLTRKFNCHQRRCWRVGTHEAAGGQFLLCSRHHPDYRGKKPTRELIEQLHRQHIERGEAIDHKLDEIQRRLHQPGHNP
jgi:hypothetical protein